MQVRKTTVLVQNALFVFQCLVESLENLESLLTAPLLTGCRASARACCCFFPPLTIGHMTPFLLKNPGMPRIQDNRYLSRTFSEISAECFRALRNSTLQDLRTLPLHPQLPSTSCIFVIICNHNHWNCSMFTAS